MNSGDEIAKLREQVISVAVSLVKAKRSQLEILLADLRESDGGRPLSSAIVQTVLDHEGSPNPICPTCQCSCAVVPGNTADVWRCTECGAVFTFRMLDRHGRHGRGGE